MALGALTAIYASVLLAEVAAPLAFDGKPWIPIAAVYEAKEIALITPTASAADLRLADQLAAQELSLAPFSTGAWLRRVQARIQLAGGHLSPEAAIMLQRSYAEIKFDPDYWDWRAHIALSVWDEAPPDVRAQVIEEIKVLGKPMHSKKATLLASLPGIANPAGRLAGAFILAVP